MKKYACIFIPLFLFSSILSAQLPLTSNSFNFQAGDTVIQIFFSDSVTSPGPAGANQTWDFSFLQERDRDTAFIKAVSSSTAAAQFPNATIAGLQFSASIDSGSLDAFFSTDTDSFTYWGVYNEITNAGITVTQTIPYSDPEILLTYPLMFMDSLADRFYGEYDAGNNFFFARTGGNYHQYDGYGTLIMPGGISYDNVIRVKIVQTYKDSALDQSFPLETLYESENVYFFAQGAQLPYLQYNKFSLTAAPNPAVITHSIKAYAGDAVVSTAPPLDPDTYTLFPNPSKGISELEIESDGFEKLKVEIMDLNGRTYAVLYQGISRPGSNRYPIDTQTLSPGLYLVKIELAEKRGFVKLQVQD